MQPSRRLKRTHPVASASAGHRSGRPGARRRQNAAPGRGRALAFQFDQTADGRILKLLHVVDEFTREALAIRCARRLDSDARVALLDGLVAARGPAGRARRQRLRSAAALRDWCRFSHTETSYIKPARRCRTPTSSRSDRRIRDELLSQELFETLAEAKVLIKDWRPD